MALIKDKILVIEDEKSISYLLGTVLTANGYDVIKAYTGTEACEMLDAYCPDLILLDLGLPDMDGVDIIRRVRSRGTAPIVVVSARTRERDKIEALDLGADDYITKPFGGADPCRAAAHQEPGGGAKLCPDRSIPRRSAAHRL